MNSKQRLDEIYSHYRQEVGKFVFDDKVASAFDDMIRRSVPGYSTVLAMVRVFAEQYAKDDSNCYDLGCSLGAATLALRKGIGDRRCAIVAVDNSASMLSRCKSIIDADSGSADVELIEKDINNIHIENASVVVLNYTLQFINPAKRNGLIKRIYDSMLDGGILILSEKIALEKETCSQFNIDMHHHFKRLHGYSDLEISQKRKALENVLIPDTLETHEDRLEKAGFERIHLWFRCFNFVSIAAVK